MMPNTQPAQPASQSTGQPASQSAGQTATPTRGRADGVDLMESLRRASQGPPTPISRRRLKAAQARKRTEGNAIVDAIASEWSAVHLIQGMGRAMFKPDPNFALTADRIEELRDRWALDRDQVLSLASASSEGELQHMLQTMYGIGQARERLASKGFTGAGASLLAGIIDPVALTLDAATFGATAPLTRGNKALRMRHLLRGGVVAAVGGGGTEAIIASQDPTRGLDDVLLVTTGAFALGSGLGAALGPRAQIAMDRMMESVRRQVIASEIAEGTVFMEVTEKGQKLRFTPEATREDRQRTIAALSETLGDAGGYGMKGSRPMFNLDDPNDADAALDFFVDSADDAYGMYGPGYTEFDPAQVAEDVGKVRYGKIRWGIAGRLGQSPVEGVRRLGQMLVQDVLPRTDAQGNDIPVTQAATMWVNRMHRTTVGEWQREMLPLFRQWAKENGHELTPVNTYALRNEFQEQVGKQVIHGSPEAGETAVEQAAMLYRTKMENFRQLGRRYGIKGFDKVENDPRYFTRMAAGEKIEEAIKRAGRQADGSIDYDKGLEAVENMIADSMVSGLRREAADLGMNADEIADITRELVLKTARGYLRAIRKVDDDGNYFARSQLFSGRLDEESEKILREAGMSDAQVERIRRVMADKAETVKLQMQRERGAPQSGRIKTLLDESVTLRADNGETISMDDLFERNATRVLEVYARQMYGQAAGQRILDQFAKRYDTRVETFDDLIRVLDNEANEARLSTADLGRFRNDKKRLDASWRSMMNWRQPSNLDPQWGRILQTMRDLQFMRLMGLSGFAQIAELGTVLGEVGLTAMMQQMPALQRIFKRAADGTLDDELLQVTEAIWGHATHRLRNRVNPRLDQTDAGFEYQTGRMRELASRGKQLVADVSGMNAVNMLLKRAFEAGYVQRTANIAMGTTPRPSARRLAGMGLTESQFDAILANMKKHAKWEKGPNGGRVVNPNLDQWDTNARGWFVEAGDRTGLRAVQENDIGQMAAWMTTDVGQTLMQFKSFILAAYEQQLLYGVYTHDARIFIAWGASMLFASMAYMAKMQVLSVGRLDREEYLEERLSMRSIALNSFAYAGYASILPGVVDTGMVLLGQEKLFDYGRATGLASDFVGGNPVVDFVDKMGQVPQGVANMILSGDLNDQDVRKLTQVLPMQNVVLIGNMLRAIGALGGEKEIVRDPGDAEEGLGR